MVNYSPKNAISRLNFDNFVEFEQARLRIIPETKRQMIEKNGHFGMTYFDIGYFGPNISHFGKQSYLAAAVFDQNHKLKKFS